MIASASVIAPFSRGLHGALRAQAHAVRKRRKRKLCRGFGDLPRAVLARRAEDLHKKRHAAPALLGDLRGIELPHLPADHAHDLDGLGVLGEKLRELGRRAVVVPAGDLLGHLEGVRLRDVMRELFNVLRRDAVSRDIAADLCDLRDEPVHKIAGEEHEPVHGVAVDALAVGLKAARDPVVERACRSAP